MIVTGEDVRPGDMFISGSCFTYTRFFYTGIVLMVIPPTQNMVTNESIYADYNYICVLAVNGGLVYCHVHRRLVYEICRSS